jgi:ABC-type uncharacterized transport system involved in gliding motility auxiliary subunit
VESVAVNWEELLQKRTLIYGTGSVAAVLLLLGILVFVGLLANRYPFRWDVTKNRSQSLSAISKAVLSEVTKPLSLTAFYPEGQPERQQTKELLQGYAYQNSQVSFRFVDPERDPLVARQAGYRYPGNILLEYQGRRQMAERPDEETITGTLRKLLKTEVKKIFFLTGHGERGVADSQREGFQTASQALRNEGYAVEDLSLLTQAGVPKEAVVVVVAGPQKHLFPNEVAALKAYLARGGRLLVLLAPFEDGGLKELLASYGVGLDDGMILDQNQMSQALGASAVMPLVFKYGPHRITQNFTNIVTIFPLARALSLNREVKGVKLLPLASTSPSSWEKLGREWLKRGTGNFEAQKDKKGPFTLAALAEIDLSPKGPGEAGKKAVEEKKAEMVVFGNVDFANNTYFNLSGNGDLFLNSINFLAQEEKQILIRRPDKQSQPLLLTGLQNWVLLMTSLVAVPLIMVGAGIFAYFRRRARR